MTFQSNKTLAWGRIKKRATQYKKSNSFKSTNNQSRFFDMSLRIGPLLIDYSKQRIDHDSFQELINLANEIEIEEKIQAQVRGFVINNTEQRRVLHTALRSEFKDTPSGVAKEVQRERSRMLNFTEAVRSGAWIGYTGKSIKQIVHIGIGGSQLGPQFVCQALNESDIEFLFLSNIDRTATEKVLRNLDPETTLVIVVSKTFTTLETMSNARALRSWFLERTGDFKSIQKHFVAVSSNKKEMDKFGISTSNRFRMWDWVGGRFSLWSSVGLPIAIAIGEKGFQELLRGAASMDEHFRSAALSRNAPVILALLTIWNTNFLDANSHAVLVYDERLKLFTQFLQQLEMESNGKSVQKNGAPVDMQTSPIIWGGVGTNGQHAFHQLLHQGTRSYTADFIATINSSHKQNQQHNWLLANALGQSKAMRQGQRYSDDTLAEHKNVAGNHATTTILLDNLNPENLGYLISLYENKVSALGFIWNINSFDQYGVELGKILAEQIYKELTTNKTFKQDISTAGLIAAIKNRSK